MKDLAATMEREHAALGRELRKVLEAVKPARPDQKLVTDCLVAIRGHLTAHFKLEEEGGYMEWITEVHPEQRRLVGRLFEEHRDLGDMLDHLLIEARTSSRLESSFAGKIHAWLEAMHKHEAQENKLVMTAVNEDVGTKD